MTSTLYRSGVNEIIGSNHSMLGANHSGLVQPYSNQLRRIENSSNPDKTRGLS